MKLVFHPEPFDKDICTWDTYLRRLKNKFTLHNVPDGKKVSILIDALGAKHYEQLRELCYPDEPEDKTFDDVCSTLSSYFQPEPNKYAERYIFHSQGQSSSESIHEYAAALQKLSQYCEFSKDWLQEALVTQFIVGTMNEELRLKLIEAKYDDFNKAVEFAITYEISKAAAAKSTPTTSNSTTVEEIAAICKTPTTQWSST